jgi:hypothetical protein
MCRFLFCVAFMLLLGGLAASDAKGQPKAGDILEENSVWKGTASIGKTVSVDAELSVSERKGKDFKGQYKTENGANVLDVKGTIENDQIKFKYTKIVKSKKEFPNLVGQEVKGKKIEAKLKWPDSKTGVNQYVVIKLELDE